MVMMMMVTMMTTLTRHIRGVQRQQHKDGTLGELKQYIEEPLCDMKKKDTLKWWLVSEIFMSSMVRALISRIYDRCIP